MTTENRIRLERLTGRIEGLAIGIKNEEIVGGLFDIAKAIDSIMKDESEGDTE